MRLWAIMVGLVGALTSAQGETLLPTEFPFEFRDGLLWVEVQVPQASEPLHFLLDSGAGVSAINLSTAQRLGLNLGNEVKVRGVGCCTKGYWPQILSAKIGGIPLPEQFLAVDLSQLSQSCNERIDGLLGADFVQGKVLQIDFVDHKVRWLASSVVSSNAEVLPLKMVRQVLQVPVQVNGRPPEWFRLDTGCATALQWVAGTRIFNENSPGIAIGLSRLGIPLTSTSVALGKEKFESVATGLHKNPIFHGESGLLGTGLLARFSKITINTKAKCLVLEGRRN
jgi:hypothetical protein